MEDNHYQLLDGKAVSAQMKKRDGGRSRPDQSRRR